jgi:hypothetical protein
MEISTGDFYTNDECRDPAPVTPDYQPWDQILEDLFTWEDYANEDMADLLANLDAIAANFQILRGSYPLLSQQARDLGLTYVNCPLLDTSPTATPAADASTSTPTQAPTTAALPGTTTAPSTRSSTNTTAEEEMPTASPSSTTTTNDPTSSTSGDGTTWKRVLHSGFALTLWTTVWCTI